MRNEVLCQPAEAGTLGGLQFPQRVLDIAGGGDERCGWYPEPCGAQLCVRQQAPLVAGWPTHKRCVLESRLFLEISLRRGSAHQGSWPVSVPFLFCSFAMCNTLLKLQCREALACA